MALYNDVKACLILHFAPVRGSGAEMAVTNTWRKAGERWDSLTVYWQAAYVGWQRIACMVVKEKVVVRNQCTQSVSSPSSAKITDRGTRTLGRGHEIGPSTAVSRESSTGAASRNHSSGSLTVQDNSLCVSNPPQVDKLSVQVEQLAEIIINCWAICCDTVCHVAMWCALCQMVRF